MFCFCSVFNHNIALKTQVKTFCLQTTSQSIVVPTGANVCGARLDHSSGLNSWQIEILTEVRRDLMPNIFAEDFCRIHFLERDIGRSWTNILHSTMVNFIQVNILGMVTCYSTGTSVVHWGPFSSQRLTEPIFGVWHGWQTTLTLTLTWSFVYAITSTGVSLNWCWS